MSPASNTRDCFAELIGHEVVGVLFDALPFGSPDIARGTKSLIFDDGRALTIASNGSYWIDQRGDVDSAVSRKVSELKLVTKELGQVLNLAGRANRAEAVPS